MSWLRKSYEPGMEGGEIIASATAFMEVRWSMAVF